MAKIYKVNLDEKKYNVLIEKGWVASPPVLGKVFEVSPDSEAAGTLKYILNDSAYQKVILSDKETKKHFKELGIKFKKGVLVENEMFKKLSSFWQIIINTNENGWLSISSIEEYYPFEFCKKELLDEYCKEQLDELRELGFLEEVEVEDKNVG